MTGPARWGFFVLALYSAVLLTIELVTSQDYVHHFFTDIEGPVPFYAINTTLSVALLWGTALLFVVTAHTLRDVSGGEGVRRFALSQAAIFGFLGFDDRFKFHEEVGEWFGIGDHFVLATVALLEVAFLIWLAGPRVLQGRTSDFLRAAVALFALMFVIDALGPHDMRLRLSLEDLFKTWSGVCFFLFGWSIYTRCLDTLRGRDTLLLTPFSPGEHSLTDGEPGRVLVLGHDPRIQLAIARSLGRRGVSVELAACPRDAVACYSRYVERHHELPAGDSGDYGEALLRLLARERFGLVLPATERAMFDCVRRRDLLGSETPVHLPGPQAFEAGLDKAKTWQLAERLGIPVPTTHLLDAEDRIDETLRALDFPAFVKPVASVSSLDASEKHYVRYVADIESARRHVVHLIERHGRVLVQSAVPGRGVGVNVLAHEGKLLLAFQHERLHEATGHGSTYRESVRLDPALLDAASKLVAELRHTGVAMVEFRVDPDSGRWFLIELNARFWGSLPLAVAAGADFPFYLYRLLVYGDTSGPGDYRVGVRSRVVHSDARWLWRRFVRRTPADAVEDADSLGWRVNDVPLRKVLGGLLRALTLRDHSDTFALDDPVPALVELWRLASGGGFRRRRSNLPATAEARDTAE